MDSAIYFPYIKVPKNRWFTRVLLYWNHVGSIVPIHYIDSPSILGNYMYDLIQEGLVEPIAPAKYVHKIERFSYAFLDYIKSPYFPIPNDIESRKALPTSTIHIEKIEPIARELIEMGLARPSPRPREYPWFEVESHTATLFMAYLASSLGKLNELRSEPITYNLKEFTSISRLYPREKVLSQICKNRTLILDNVLPAPSVDLHPSEIADFKEEHGKELIRFRNKLEKELNQLSAIEDTYLQNRQIEQIILDIENEKKEIRELMMARGWGKIKSASLLYCIPPALSLILAIQKGEFAEEIIGASSFMLQAYDFYSSIRAEDSLRFNNAVYAVLAEKRWTPQKNNDEIVIGEEI